MLRVIASSKVFEGRRRRDDDGDDGDDADG